MTHSKVEPDESGLYKQSQGARWDYCPVCGERLEYGVKHEDGDTEVFEWTCDGCGVVGSALFVFTAHQAYT